MLLLNDISISQEHRKSSNYKAPTITTHVNMERIDRWYLCEYGLPFPRGLPIVARLLLCPSESAKTQEAAAERGQVAPHGESVSCYIVHVTTVTPSEL